MHVTEETVRYTVGVVGAGVAGLALARMLEVAGISYILLEAYHSITPDAGAGIGFLPNGLRILDQMGALPQLEGHCAEHVKWHHIDGETGKRLTTSDTLTKLPKIFGYGVKAITRQSALQALYDTLEDKSNLHTSKKVIRVQSMDDKAVLFTADGSSYTCDFVAGADGVHSRVRSEIQAMTHEPRVAPEYLTAQSATAFGISNPVTGTGEGLFFNVYRHGVCIFMLTGPEGQVFWFVTENLKEPIPYRGPKYGPSDIDRICASVADIPIVPGVYFRDVFAARTESRMLPLEEGVSEVWHASRMCLLGDACHKMVPHGAQGGNQALESAASFVNHLRKLLSTKADPSLADIDETLVSYTEERRARAAAAMNMAHKLCRTLLRVEPGIDQYLQALPSFSWEQTLQGWASMLTDAVELESWPLAVSEETLVYRSQVKKIRAGSSLASLLAAASN